MNKPFAICLAQVLLLTSILSACSGKQNTVPENNSIAALPSKFIFIDNFSRGWSRVSGIVINNDTSEYLYSGCSLYLNGAQTSTGKGISLPNLNKIATLVLWAKSEDWSHISTINMRLRGPGGVDFRQVMANSDFPVEAYNGWRKIIFSPNTSYTGIYDTNITTVEIRTTSTAMGDGSYPDIWLNNLGYLDYIGSFVTICFDDGHESAFTIAKPLLESHGYRGVVAPITSRIGKSQHMTLAQLQSLDDKGWDVASHGVSHLSADNLTIAEKDYDLSSSRAYLIDNGIRCHTFIAPFGDYNSEAYKYYDLQRAGGSYCGSPVGFNRYLVRYRSINTEVDKNTALNIMEKMVTHGGGWMNLAFHELGVDGLSYLKAILDYIQLHNIKVITYSDILDSYPNPPE